MTKIDTKGEKTSAQGAEETNLSCICVQVVAARLSDFSKASAEIGFKESKPALTKFAHKRLKKWIAQVPLLPLM
jgi:hypothetical protein